MFDPNYVAPVFAFDGWNVVFFVVVAVIWILGHLFGQEKEAPRPQRRRAPQAGAGRPGRSPADEIDRFLREVANRRKQGHAGVPEVEVLRPQPARRQSGTAPSPGRRVPVSNRGREPSPAGTPVGSPRTSPSRPAADQSAIEPLAQVREHEPLGSDIAEHVRTHLGALGARRETIASPSTHQVAAGLTDVSEVAAATARVQAGTPGSLANLLASGVGLRQAIVLTEVFGPPRARRPLHR